VRRLEKQREERASTKSATCRPATSYTASRTFPFSGSTYASSVAPEKGFGVLGDNRLRKSGASPAATAATAVTAGVRRSASVTALYGDHNHGVRGKNGERETRRTRQ
jgi:hypothetical protein